MLNNILVIISLFFYILYNNRKRIYYVYMWLKLFLYVKIGIFIKKLGFFGGLIMPKLSPDELFITKYKNKFLEKVQPIIDNEFINFYGFNDNVDILCEFNNEDELMWKRRIIILNTPYGNVAMFYDIYHSGFSYYADTKNIPYNILNCVSMNYVLIYKCLHFYIDNTMIEKWLVREIVKEEIVNNKPFIPRLEEKIQSEIQPQKSLQPLINKKIVAKLKNNRIDINNGPIYNKNRFIYCGKITDMPSFNVKRKVMKILKPKKMSFREYKESIINHDGLFD